MQPYRLASCILPFTVKEAQRWHSTSDEGTFTSPTQSSSLFNIRSAIRDDEDEELGEYTKPWFLLGGKTMVLTGRYNHGSD